MANHLDDSTISELVGGSIPEERRAGIDEHLAGCTECRKLVSTLARENAAVSLTTAGPLVVESVPPPFARTLVEGGLFSGRKLGNYVLSSKLDAGAMGTVYLARHQFLEREVAVKILHTHVQDQAELATRFLREAQAVSRLHSPNLVEVIDFGRSDDEYLYLVMEKLDGETLADYLKHAGKLDTAEICRIATEIARGLAVAHAAGIVHRDLKPANIFLTQTSNGQNGPIKILDFGVAKIREFEQNAAVQTRSGALFGSPAYMSPEQCRGDSSHVTAQSDLYTLGVILFELATGELPFLSSSLIQILRAHLEQPAPLLQSSRPELPTSLGAIVARALQKSPERRFQSAEELAAALAVVSTETSPPARARSLSRPLAIALAMGAVAVGTAIFLGSTRNAIPVKPLVVQPPAVILDLSSTPADMAVHRPHLRHDSATPLEKETRHDKKPPKSETEIILQYPE